MRINELFEAKDEDHDNHSDHADALRSTGFWGAQAAGCLFFAQETRRFLISHRSAHVEQPNSWGSWGGAIDKGEDPLEAVKREVHEEAGYSGTFATLPMFVFVKGTFRYSNFLVVVPKEFTPHLDWENQGYVWAEFGKWPQPLHFGLVALFKDAPSIELMHGLAMGSHGT
jgi:8-oxo-dGTP pyrophosphatase MutT (NUDIX family)